MGTGFKDEDLIRLSEKLRADYLLSSSVRPSNYNAGDALQPDTWFRPALVWELQAADLSKSSVHRGGVGLVDKRDASRGVGLRFPRFIREREDKRAEGATSSEQIVDMYCNQGDGFDEGKKTNDDEEDDFI